MITVKTKDGVVLTFIAENFPIELKLGEKQYVLRLTKQGKLLLN